MSATFPDLAKLPLTTTLQDLTTATPAGKVRKWKVRFANVGAADAYGDLVATNGTIVIDRAKNYPVPYQHPGSAPDLETITLPPGWKLQAKASANGFIQASAEPIEVDLSDFAT